MPEYSTELRAEVDAAMAKADKHGWAVDEDGDLVLRVPTCWKEGAWQDKAGRDNAAAIVALHNAYSALTAHIDAQAERIAELEAENARLRDGVMDMSSPVREQIYTAIRTFTCATVAEAEEATRAIIRLVTGATPSIPNARRSRREESGYPRTSDSTWHPGDEM